MQSKQILVLRPGPLGDLYYIFKVHVHKQLLLWLFISLLMEITIFNSLIASDLCLHCSPMPSYGKLASMVTMRILANFISLFTLSAVTVELQRLQQICSRQG